MSTPQVASPPFWPSRRLWLKFFIGLMYVPLLFSVLIWLLLRFAFSPMNAQGLYLTLFFLLLLGGPVLAGLLLMPSWRGAGAAFVAMVSTFLVWNGVGHLGIQNLPQSFSEPLSFTLISASGISVLEIIIRDITKRSELGGLGIGIVVGFIISLLFVSSFSPYDPRINIPPDYASIFGLVGWSAQFVISWLTAFLFVELYGGRVGWGGVIVWIALVSSVFGLSFALMK
jgi:hypothetical protein